MILRKEKYYLVVGSDSFVGKGLMAYFEQVGRPVLGTTRCSGAVDDTHLFLDLSEDAWKWTLPKPISVAIICASIAKLVECERNPKTTARINVDGICALVNNLVKEGVFVIYISTDHVFDGSLPHRLPDEPYSPITEYGRQKANAERKINQWGDAVSIVRFTKILGPGFTLFSEWVKLLKKGEPIHPFMNMVFAPIPLSVAISVLYLVGEKRLSGILQVSGKYDVSYAQAAYRGAELLGIDSRLVQPVRFEESDLDIVPSPLHTTLDVQRLESALGIELPDVWWTIDQMFLQPQLLTEPQILRKVNL